MSDSPPVPGPLRLFVAELRELVGTAGVVWRMVPTRHRWSLIAAVAVMTIGGTANTVLPILSGKIVDRVALGVEKHEPKAQVFEAVVVLLAGVAGMVVVRESLQVFRRFLVENTCTRIERYLSVETIGHIMQADLTRLTHEKVGVLHGRIFRSVHGFMRLVRLSFLDFFPALVSGGMAIGYAVSAQPWLGLAMAGVIPCSVGLTVWQLMSQKRVRLKLIRVNEEMDGTVVELLGGLDYVRVANTRAQEVGRVAKAAEQKRSQEFGHHVAMSFFGSGKAVVEGLFHVGVLALAAYFAINGEIQFGEILTFSMLYLNAMAPVNEIHRVLDEGHEASLRVNDLKGLLALPVDPSFNTGANKDARLDDAAPVVKAEGVKLEYALPNGKRLSALNGVDLEIYPGETVGIAGKSGCGKSTWLKVLMRLIHPTEGRVWVKGIPLEDVSRETISHLVGYVGQSPFVFSGTIEQNICYGAGKWLPEDVRRAAMRAGIHHEIMAMPNGYDTPVAERGQSLSGGQRQRVALARVFLQNPPILILDEATSALDTISERRVQMAIADARKDRTVILVAHRLSTFADADRILVFDEGRIVETGSYGQLIAGNGLFAELVRCAEMGTENQAPPAKAS